MVTLTATDNYFTLIVIITRPLKKTSGLILAVLVTKAKLLRSGVSRKVHAPF